MISDTMRQHIDLVLTSERNGRWIVAGLGLTALREQYEALDPETLADDERSWEAFADKYIALSSYRIHDLIGRMVHKGALLCCTKCSAKVKNPCACGVPYVTGHRWEEPPLRPKTLRERVIEVLMLAPEMSNRAVAKQIGCDHKTVGKVRKTLAASPQIPHAEVRA